MSDFDDRVVEFVTRFAAEHGFSPTISEIVEAVDSSTGTVHRCLAQLARQQRITYQPNRPRTIRVTDDL